MEFLDWIALISERVKRPLPGKVAHLDMAPQPVDMRRFEGQFRDKPRSSGVLLLLYPENGEIYFPLIKRPEYLGVHSGQIALPGGKMELEDETIIHTAISEAEEEIGISRHSVQVIGQMSELYIPTSNFLVSPVIGFLEEKPILVPEEKEVQRIISTSLKGLLDKAIRKRKKLDLASGFQLDTPYFEIDGEVVWGATAMILSELSFLLSEESF